MLSQQTLITGPESVVVMGVSGSGKTAVGRAIAQRLDRRFVDADSLHSPANIAKMAAGQPLNDSDREGWLDTIAALIAADNPVVLACSALRRRYRDRLRLADAGLTFVYLHGSYQTIRARMQSREDHYFTGDHMLKSQFSQLEEPVGENVVHVPVEQDLDAVIATAMMGLPGTT